MKILKHKRTIRVILLFALITLGIGPAGCGKKGPPITPRSVPLPVVTDLQAEIEGDNVTLSWSLPKKGEGAAAPAAGYVVHRSKTTLAEADCLDCPVLFNRVADIPVTKALTESGPTYSEPLEKGYRYIYKVTVYTPTDDVGPDSNPVEIIH